LGFEVAASGLRSFDWQACWELGVFSGHSKL
jgi:hypothetical protein